MKETKLRNHDFSLEKEQNTDTFSLYQLRNNKHNSIQNGSLIANSKIGLIGNFEQEFALALLFSEQIYTLAKRKAENRVVIYSSKKGFTFIFPKISQLNSNLLDSLNEHRLSLEPSKFKDSSNILIISNRPSGEISGKPMINFSRSVFKENRYVGILSIQVDLDEIQNMLNLGRSIGESYLIDADGNILVKGPESHVSKIPLQLNPNSFDSLNRTTQYFWTAYEIKEGSIALIHRITILDFALFTLKSLLPYWLLILSLFAIAIMYQKLKSSMNLILKLTNSDHLTGIANRRAFLTWTKTDIEICKKQNIPWSLMIIDIDHFKKINDRFGHDVGDTVLTNVAKVLDSIVSKPHHLCRWGGEEFAVFVINSNAKSSVNFADKIRSTVENNVLLEDNSPVTLSIGIAKERIADTIEDVYRSADQALYRAKAMGRNRVCREDELNDI
ncbi:sensor domain-containing diguanylate cyclase [Leptospira sp. FAT2]|uniref:sensor domain-containing diguanylate cyclase n=1 Tax=Leptospira sanjuanensis TaxID=2879643 RepID=UPI001EE7CF14|nr:diguanylate cyclase [Leptospira sanjuanensis]MCG6192322.1 sensor domain-containing diguanylate cyclase [Leptospira sanjuanensis]